MIAALEEAPRGLEKPDEPIDLSIVIVSWNVKTHVLNCLESIDQSRGSLRIQTILVDNASKDGTVDVVKARHSGTLVIQNAKNVGFAQANNQGLPYCTGRHVLFLNPDTLVLDQSLQTLVEAADASSDIGVVGPKLISPDGSIQLVSGRGFPTISNWFCYYSFLGQLFRNSTLLGGYLMSYWDHASSRDVEAVCGAAMLVPRKVIREIGGLDESHPMYLEDVEYCWRAIRAGKRVRFVAEASIIHFGGQSSARVPVKARLLILEGQRRFCCLYGTAWSSMRFRIVVIALALWRLPILAIAKAIAILLRSRHPRIVAISFRAELVNLLWAAGVLSVPTMDEML